MPQTLVNGTTLSPSSVVIAGSLYATGLTLQTNSVTVAGDFVTNTVTAIPGGSQTDPVYQTLNVSSALTAASLAVTTSLTVGSTGATRIESTDSGASLAFQSTKNFAWYTAGAIGTDTATMQLDNQGNLITHGAVTARSDARVKRNVSVIPSALDKVLALRGVTFERTDLHAEPGRRHVGFIAQEVDEVMPEAVYEDLTTGLKSVAYGNMVAVLVQAMHELVEEVRSGGSGASPSLSE